MKKIAMLVMIATVIMTLLTAAGPVLAEELPPFGGPQNQDQWQIWDRAPYAPQ